MAIFDIFKRKQDPPPPPAAIDTTPEPQAVGWVAPQGFGYNRVQVLNYDGEKDLGGMGQIRKYLLDHQALRMRSHQLYLDSDVCAALFNRSAMWGIGGGLKLQACPETELLESEGISIEAEDFNEAIESRFSVFASTAMCDYQETRNLGEMATEGWVNGEVGGDVLVIMRLVDGTPKVQLIDGSHLQTPLLWGSGIGIDIVNPVTKNRVRHGVEIDDKGKHVAYYIYKGEHADILTGYERVEARMNVYPYSEMARLVYGLKYRIDNVRGIPVITAVMETASKMGRFKDATLAGAESRAKIAYTIEHTKESTGEPVQIQQMAAASGFGNNTDLPTDSMGEAMANKIAVTTENMTYNMPIGAKLAMHDSKQEYGFNDFYTVNFDLVCAVAGYPPEVIMSKYNSNYSASRAAIKDFEHTLDVKRKKFASQFYQLIYNFCLDVWVLSGKIDAPGYLQALASQNEMALASYRKSRWAGDAVPHIDPYKEVQAIRAMLPEDSANMPLITLEQAVEILGNGDFDDVMEQYEKERDNGISRGIKPVEPKQPAGVQPNGNPAKKRDE